MNTTKHITIAAALTSLFAMQAPAAQADDEISLLSMKPLHAVDFDRGDEHIVGYYLSQNGKCTLHVTQTTEPNWDEPYTFTATRFEAVIQPGEKTRYVSAGGHAFEFACAGDALAMTVQPLERVASSDKR